MIDDTFEWDDAKAAANWAKHGVSFVAATRVFDDLFAVERSDDRFDYGEPRFIIVGRVGERLLTVAYTLRGERIRIISARYAEPREAREYHG